ncbi:hypothetical protein NAS2_0696 [Conexivisphaera calida]|uniref:Uncharacterized protein n=1 Tax=Conexivisphaera calida TaxID=1874277 RepID=A0A4P2VLU1_9ARCH|nr:hypothetical protein NAS2_0696 [Conexivisphaera calida]
MEPFRAACAIESTSAASVPGLGLSDGPRGQPAGIDVT